MYERIGIVTEKLGRGVMLGASVMLLGCFAPSARPLLPSALESDGGTGNDDDRGSPGSSSGTTICADESCPEPTTSSTTDAPQDESTTTGETEGSSEGTTAEPPAWTCLPALQGDEICDCGCGAVDVDCEGLQPEHCERCQPPELGGCDFDGTCGAIDPENNGGCLDPQLFWTCPPAWFIDDQCDCGCGAPDPACETLERSSCDRCGCGQDGSCELLIDGASWRCIPDEWSCPPTWYQDDGFCDCGCGSLDPFCPSTSIEDCDYCGGPAVGGCDIDGSCELIDPENTAACIEPRRL